MGIIDQAKDAAETVKDAAETVKDAAGNLVDKAKDKELGDEFFAKYIMRFTNKQEHINELLKAEGSNYRIANIEVAVGVPPLVNFIIEKVTDSQSQKLR